MKAIQISWKGIILAATAGVFFLIATIVQATDNPRANRDTSSARDRVAAFCDPAAYPRELRGEFLDCSGFAPTNTPAAPTQSAQQPSPTQGVSQPTATPRVGDPVNPTATPVPTTPVPADQTQSQPTATPVTTDGGNGGVNGVGGGGDTPRIGEAGGEIKGLSYTSGSELAASDIILLTGILCLLLYVRSKIAGSTAKLPNRKKRLSNY